MAQGKLIAFEGIDGCGKSTQLRLLGEALRSRGIDVLCTRQPTSAYRDNPAVRAYLEGGDSRVGMKRLCRLAAEDRRGHLAGIVLPSLARGTWVLCDRYVYSSFAFFRARGVDLPFVERENRGVRIPDLTVLLDMSPECARQRVLAREGAITKHEEKDLQFMGVVRDTFLQLSNESFLVLDGRLSIADMHAAILNSLRLKDM